MQKKKVKIKTPQTKRTNSAYVRAVKMKLIRKYVFLFIFIYIFIAFRIWYYNGIARESRWISCDLNDFSWIFIGQSHTTIWKKTRNRITNNIYFNFTWHFQIQPNWKAFICSFFFTSDHSNILSNVLYDVKWMRKPKNDYVFFCLCYVFISILWLDLHNRITSKWKNEPTIKTHQMEQPFVLHRRTFWILRSANSIETFMVKVNIIFLDFTQHKTISIHLLPFIEFTFSNFILFGKWKNCDLKKTHTEFVFDELF